MIGGVDMLVSHSYACCRSYVDTDTTRGLLTLGLHADSSACVVAELSLLRGTTRIAVVRVGPSEYSTAESIGAGVVQLDARLCVAVALSRDGGSESVVRGVDSETEYSGDGRRSQCRRDGSDSPDSTSVVTRTDIALDNNDRRNKSNGRLCDDSPATDDSDCGSDGERHSIRVRDPQHVIDEWSVGVVVRVFRSVAVASAEFVVLADNTKSVADCRSVGADSRVAGRLEVPLALLETALAHEYAMTRWFPLERASPGLPTRGDVRLHMRYSMQGSSSGDAVCEPRMEPYKASMPASKSSSAGASRDGRARSGSRGGRCRSARGDGFRGDGSGSGSGTREYRRTPESSLQRHPNHDDQQQSLHQQQGQERLSQDHQQPQEQHYHEQMNHRQHATNKSSRRPRVEAFSPPSSPSSSLSSESTEPLESLLSPSKSASLLSLSSSSSSRRRRRSQSGVRSPRRQSSRDDSKERRNQASGLTMSNDDNRTGSARCLFLSSKGASDAAAAPATGTVLCTRNAAATTTTTRTPSGAQSAARTRPASAFNAKIIVVGARGAGADVGTEASASASHRHSANARSPVGSPPSSAFAASQSSSAQPFLKRKPYKVVFQKLDWSSVASRTDSSWDARRDAHGGSLVMSGAEPTSGDERSGVRDNSGGRGSGGHGDGCREKKNRLCDEDTHKGEVGYKSSSRLVRSTTAVSKMKSTALSSCASSHVTSESPFGSSGCAKLTSSRSSDSADRSTDVVTTSLDPATAARLSSLRHAVYACCQVNAETTAVAQLKYQAERNRHCDSAGGRDDSSGIRSDSVGCVRPSVGTSEASGAIEFHAVALSASSASAPAKPMGSCPTPATVSRSHVACLDGSSSILTSRAALASLWRALVRDSGGDLYASEIQRLLCDVRELQKRDQRTAERGKSSQ